MMASHVVTQRAFATPHAVQRSTPKSAVGHTAGSDQHVPSTSTGQSSGEGVGLSVPNGSRRAQIAPAGHSTSGPGLPGSVPGGRLGSRFIPHAIALFPHSPCDAAGTPAARRRQSFQYVMPSHPHTGLGCSSHTTGRGSQVPPTSSHAAFSQ
jgi:hypothetical protein